MKRIAVALIAVAVALSSFQVAFADPPGQKLSADQIQHELVGHTTYGTVVSGQSYSMWVAPDGTQKIKLPTFTDSGTYRITPDGQWCRKWKVSTGGNEVCVAVYKSGDTFYSVGPAGDVTATYTAKPGNVEHL